MTAQLRPVLVAGGGPVGVIAALALARQGIPVHVYEAGERVSDMPRASTTHPATLEMLAELRLVEEVIACGVMARTFQFWDRPARRVIAEFDHAILKDDTPYPFVVQCEQHKLAGMAIDRLRTASDAKVYFSARVENVEAFDDHIAITIDRDGRKERVEGSYLIGADGGRSTVRKALGIEFEGYTFPERFLVLTTSVDFAAEQDAGYRSYFSDPDEWANLFKVAGDGSGPLWRVVFPTVPGETDDEVLGDAPAQGRLHKFFPRRGDYPLVHRNIYNVHQRVAATFQKGRVFLAGDAAHVNNPIGGLGLNCGIHDAMEIAGLLGSVLQGRRPTGDLALYDQRRRPINIEYVDFLRRTSENPQAHRAFLLRTSLLESVRRATTA
jgi:3-(3-hydroxy-phenyl)propionate hydroxylase